MRNRILLGVVTLWASSAFAGPSVTDDHIKVDQFGYLPDGVKVAVLSDPQIGFNAPDPFTPGATYEIRRWSDDSTAYSGPVAQWHGGDIHDGSGDKAWWFDFTALVEEGSFYVYDPTNDVGSYRFEISKSAYLAALNQAVRTFYYQRCGTHKSSLFAGADWADAVCHVGALQDTDCRSVLDTTPVTSLDLSGGWHDAGDYNKYINFADDVVHDLVGAFEDNPALWGDSTGIPESGNGIPDLLDEVKWELDWILGMQLPDGSVLHKVSVTDWSASSPPGSDSAPRRYAEATASATLSACGALAHAAIVYRSLSDPAMQAYADTLESAALGAWAWVEANPGLFPSNYDNTGFLNASAEDDAYQQEMTRLNAAAYLLVLTGESRFRDYFDAHYTDAHMMQWQWVYPFEYINQDGLLYYLRSPMRTTAVASDIQAKYFNSIVGTDHLLHVLSGDDAYRAYLLPNSYVWGSNRVTASQGGMYLNVNRYAMDPDNEATYVEAAVGFLHYLHGVNPLGFVYLSNMADHGAENSIQEFYHAWFADGTDWDNASTSLYGPAPGFVPGGPNAACSPDPSYSGPALEPPLDQPDQKSYRDWNTGWPENSWEVTENAIGYQGAYIRLLARFVTCQDPPATPEDSLRLSRNGSDPELSWAACSGADSYGILRCNAEAGPCLPVVSGTADTPFFVDTDGSSTHFWYRIEAVNACGNAP